jgi:HK97 gp10 family phage protein
MVKVDVKVTNNTPELLAKLQGDMLSFVAQGGQLIRANAVLDSPYDTGNLRSSIITEAFVEDGIPSSETGPTAEYAPFLEYGTRFQPAQPFMEPGYQASVPGIERLARRLLG